MCRRYRDHGGYLGHWTVVRKTGIFVEFTVAELQQLPEIAK
jgi:hypothetical protein